MELIEQNVLCLKKINYICITDLSTIHIFFAPCEQVSLNFAQSFFVSYELFISLYDRSSSYSSGKII